MKHNTQYSILNTQYSIRNTKVILALDVESLKKAKYFLDKLYPHVRIFKVGIQLFTAEGIGAIKLIQSRGAEIFLDLKFHDIPNTVAQAVRQAVRLKVKMLSLHISGGCDMIQAAARAADDESRRLKIRRPLLIGVTVLTSQEASADEILKLAKLGLKAGLDGVVCSAREAAYLRKKIKRDFIIVTPGIRPPTAARGDQKRIATVSSAIAAGSDFLVIGRPILEAARPLQAFKEML